MLYGRLTYSDLRRCVTENLRQNQGDSVGFDRDLAEQLADSMDSLVALVDAKAESNVMRRQQGQLELFPN